ncbi:IclR family transcriptional regulator [Salipiger bermudensis]|uniref:Transcriptional regulatory protein n=2 Tax=Salipiger TaxID=263377 RepID=Q0FK46_SALBH|nr:IclR family transcriptional regulator [Salipiger bermudensis]EAU44559.1 transcriptional regulatory protein [Salipiger bermudensis HTCC2601]MAE90608.1 IclR family transcriptional regulator [Pelagibaca sp.]MBR9892624.1 IclR family transcriptional regulator [bacterium]MCA1284077.1 IclR family transcriptional regulator [Salipiger bermudensis]
MPPTTSKRKSTEPKSEGRGVQSIEIGARLLSALVEEVEPMMLKDLAQVAGFAPAQAHAYLVSFRKTGLVEQDADTGRYRLGRFALDLGITSMRTTDPMALAGDAITELSERTALHVALVVWGSFGPTVVSVKESGGQLNMNTRPGTVYSMAGTASGRIFTAFLPDAIVRDAIASEKRERADSGRVGTARFMSRKEIDQIREQGYATVEQPPVPGISAYSAPVFDHSGQLVMAITIIGQDYYLEAHAEDEFIPALIEAARGLSTELGYTHSS